jgi:hypothetical protein
MRSCLSPASAIWFLDKFYVTMQFDDFDKIYSITDFPIGSPAVTVNEFNIIETNWSYGDGATKRGFITSVCYYSRQGVNGKWMFLKECAVPHQLIYSYLKACLLGSALEGDSGLYDPATGSPYTLHLTINDKRDAVGEVIAEDDQSYIFSNMPTEVRDLVFVDSRLALLNYTDGYETVEVQGDVVEIERKFIGQEDVGSINFSPVTCTFKQNSSRKFGIVFYDEHRKRCPVSGVQDVFIEPVMNVPAGMENIYMGSQDLSPNNYIIPFWTRNTTSPPANLVGAPLTFSEVSAKVVNLSGGDGPSITVPDWARYYQIVTQDNEGVNSFFESVAHVYAWLRTNENKDYISTWIGNTYGYVFQLDGTEPYVFEEGDCIRVTMPAGVNDISLGEYSEYGDNSYYDPPDTNPVNYQSFLFLEMKIVKQEGNCVFATRDPAFDSINPYTTLPNTFTDEVSYLQYGYKKMPNGRDMVLLRPFICSFRTLYEDLDFNLPLLGFIIGYDDESESENWEPGTDQPNWGGNGKYSHLVRVQIYKKSKQAGTLWYECSPVCPVDMGDNATSQKYNAKLVDYRKSLFGNTYITRYEYTKARAKPTVERIEQFGDPNNSTVVAKLTRRSVKLNVAFETTNPCNKWGNSFDNVGWGQAVAFTSIKQKVNYNTGVRFSGKLSEGGTFNELNRFAFDAEYIYPKEIGPICKGVNTSNLETEGKGLLIIGELLTVSVRIGEVQYRDVQGQGSVAISSSVLGSFQILRQSFGTQDPMSVYNENGWVIFLDRRRKALLRYNNNGITDLSETYRFRKTLAERIDRFRVYGPWVTVCATFDRKRREYILNISCILTQRYTIIETEELIPEDEDRPFCLIFRDQDGNEGLVGKLEACVVITLFGTPETRNSHYVTMMVKSNYRTFYIVQERTLDFPNQYSLSRIPSICTGLIDISIGKYFNSGGDEFYSNYEYIPALYQGYVDVVFNAQREVNWEGFMLNVSQGRAELIKELEFNNFVIWFTAVGEKIRRNAGGGVPLAMSTELRSVIIPKISTYDQWIRFIEGKLQVPIPPARIDLYGYLRADTPYGDQPGGYELDWVLPIRSKVMIARIQLVPERFYDNYDTLSQKVYNQKFLIFALSIYSPVKNTLL